MTPRSVLSPRYLLAAFLVACTPVAAFAQDAEEISIEDASGQELIDQMIGNTLIVRLPDQTDDLYGYLYLQADGTAVLREIAREPMTATISWSVDDSQRLCITENREGNARKDCGLFRLTGHDLHIVDEKGKAENLKGQLLRGAPRE